MQSRMRVVAAAGAAALASLAIAQSAHADTVLSGTTTADNAFFAFVSTNPAVLGTSIGSGNNWPSSFAVSSSTLGPGTYYLQIEAINYGGPAGFSGVFNLNGNGVFGNGTQTLTTDPSDLAYWLGGYNSANSSVAVQPWVVPVGSVLQATSYPWGNVAGTPNWIWPSDSSSSPGGASGPCDSCTVDFMAQFSVPGLQGGVPEPATWAMMLLGFCGIAFQMRRRRNTAVRIA
jgi:hypothetical protein